MDDYKYLKVSDGTGPAVVAHVTASRAVAATVIEVDTVENWPAEGIATSGVLLPSGYLDETTLTEFKFHIDSGDIVIDEFAPGYVDLGNDTDEVIVVKPNTHWGDLVAEVADVVKTTAETLEERGVLGDIRNYTANDTWTKPAGLKFIVVECRGGGGGGGGVGTTSGAGTGAGGGQGELSYKKILASALGATETVTVGAGGAGGVGNNVGATGATSSLGALCTAIGGEGGGGSSGNQIYRVSGAGGTGGVANFALPGAVGMSGGSNAANTVSGNGGGNGGGLGRATSGNGNPGLANSGGGGAGGQDEGTTTRTGGAGGSGYVRVFEYF